MNMDEAKANLRELVKKFFPETAVIWAEESSSEPPLPFVTLRGRNLTVQAFPCRNEDGENSYWCRLPLDMNLYTNGKQAGTIAFENTATANMLDFLMYLDSPEAEDYLAEKQMSVWPESPVQDLTGLFRDVSYRYRAMVSLTLTFWRTADGYANVYGEELPNSSGGGTAEQAADALETIEEVDVSEETDE